MQKEDGQWSGLNAHLLLLFMAGHNRLDAERRRDKWRDWAGFLLRAGDDIMAASQLLCTQQRQFIQYQPNPVESFPKTQRALCWLTPTCRPAGRAG